MVEGEKVRRRGRDYVAHLSVRVGRGFVTVVVRRHGVGLRAVVGVVGRVPEPSKFGPRAPCWEALKAFLATPGIVEVTGATYLIRRILAENGFWFDRKSGVYRRAPPELQLTHSSESADFYAEVGF